MYDFFEYKHHKLANMIVPENGQTQGPIGRETFEDWYVRVKNNDHCPGLQVLHSSAACSTLTLQFLGEITVGGDKEVPAWTYPEFLGSLYYSVHRNSIDSISKCAAIFVCASGVQSIAKENLSKLGFKSLGEYPQTKNRVGNKRSGHYPDMEYFFISVPDFLKNLEAEVRENFKEEIKEYFDEKS